MSQGEKLYATIHIDYPDGKTISTPYTWDAVIACEIDYDILCELMGEHATVSMIMAHDED